MKKCVMRHIVTKSFGISKGHILTKLSSKYPFQFKNRQLFLQTTRLYFHTVISAYKRNKQILTKL